MKISTETGVRHPPRKLKEYIYQPLPNISSSQARTRSNHQAFYTRVIDIEPAIHARAPIRCHMRIILVQDANADTASSLHSAPEEDSSLHSAPFKFEPPIELPDTNIGPSEEFMTLSYCWGSANRTHWIICDGAVLWITANLHKALRNIRKNMSSSSAFWKPLTPRRAQRMPLWVDALCINQADTSERNHQVASMGLTYSSSSSLVIWLGDVTISQAARFARLWRNNKTLTPEENYPNCKNCSNKALIRWSKPLGMLSSKGWISSGSFSSWSNHHNHPILDITQWPWFNRRWTVQEYQLTRTRRAFLLGEHLFCIRGVDDIPWPETPPHLRQSQREGHGINFLAHDLIKYRDAKCDDPHDCVYALLNLSGVDIPVDYDEDILYVYLRVAVDFLQYRVDRVGEPLRTFMWLAYACFRTPPKKEFPVHWPSWVLYWHQPRLDHVNPLQEHRYDPERERDSQPGDFKVIFVDHCTRTLCLEGHLIKAHGDIETLKLNWSGRHGNRTVDRLSVGEKVFKRTLREHFDNLPSGHAIFMPTVPEVAFILAPDVDRRGAQATTSRVVPYTLEQCIGEEKLFPLESGAFGVRGSLSMHGPISRVYLL